jgi:hypothetical protein
LPKIALAISILAKVAMDYAFSAIAPSHYSSDSLTIIDNAILLFECSYFQIE